MVYLAVLVLKPTQKQVYDDAAVPVIVSGPHAIIADNDAQAGSKAMRFLPDEMKDKEDRIEVNVIPFVRAR